MKFERVLDSLKNYPVPEGFLSSPFLLPENVISDVYKFIVDNKLRSCIELGSGFGATSCVMGAATEEINGKVLTVDMYLHQPVNVEVLKKHTGIGDSLEFAVDKLGYNWYLADLIAKQTKNGICEPLFDFCLLDGAHEWSPDALAFFLVAKLIKPGGWIVLDDINFTLRSVPNWQQEFGNYTDKELDSFQVGMVYELAVRQHPDFQAFRITHNGRIGWAKKVDKSCQNQLQETQAQLYQAQTLIKAMESSKFWQLRSAWFKIKQAAGLKEKN